MRISRIVGPPFRHGAEDRPERPQKPHRKQGKRSDQRPRLVRRMMLVFIDFKTELESRDDDVSPLASK